MPAEVADFKNDPVGRMRTLAKEPGRENVEAVSADLVAMPEVTQPADVLWLHLFYHDLHTKLIQAKGATAADFNRAVYERVKPGGYYVIVDHAAAAGTGLSDTQSLHRIDRLPGAPRQERRRRRDEEPEEAEEQEERPTGPLHLAIVGRPNAGKSTLLNCLLGEERMITGPEAGLTRDSISVDRSGRKAAFPTPRFRCFSVIPLCMPSH